MWPKIVGTMPSTPETAIAYIKACIAKSGLPKAKIARMADTNPVALDHVLTGRRNLGIDLALRLAKVFDIDPIEFLQGVQILPSVATSKKALEYQLLSIFTDLPEDQKNNLITIAKALAHQSSGDTEAYGPITSKGAKEGNEETKQKGRSSTGYSRTGSERVE